MVSSFFQLCQLSHSQLHTALINPSGATPANQKTAFHISSHFGQPIDSMQFRLHSVLCTFKINELIFMNSFLMVYLYLVVLPTAVSTNLSLGNPWGCSIISNAWLKTIPTLKEQVTSWTLIVMNRKVKIFVNTADGLFQPLESIPKGLVLYSSGAKNGFYIFNTKLKHDVTERYMLP